MLNGKIARTKNKNISVFICLLMVYYFIAPMEDLLTGTMGTVAKYIAVLIVFVGCIKKRDGYSLPITNENKCIIWLMFISLFSVIWSIDTTVTLGRNIQYILLPGFCLFLSIFKFTYKEYNHIILAAILGGIIASLYAIFQGITVSHVGRLVIAEENDPNNFAALLFLPATLAYGKMMVCNGLQKKLYFIVFIQITLGILFTGSRGGLISLVGMVLFYLFIRRNKQRGTMAILQAITAVVLFSLITYYLLPEALMERLFTFSSYEGDRGRPIIWLTIINYVIPNMGLLGVGAGCEGLAIRPFYGMVKGAHNTYLNMFVEFSILGLPVFVTMLYFFIKRNIKNSYFTGAAMLLGMCITIFFLDAYAKKFFWNIILLLTIHRNILKEDKALI